MPRSQQRRSPPAPQRRSRQHAAGRLRAISRHLLVPAGAEGAAAPLARRSPARRLLVPSAAEGAAAAPARQLPAKATVAVTGSAGFVGGWLTKLLLDRGYTVRACVRDAGNEEKTGFLKAMPECRPGGRLTLHAADLTKRGAYDEIFPGCHTVFHAAEVMMSFGVGRDLKLAVQDFGKERLRSGIKATKVIAEAALQTTEVIVDGINRSGSVRQLIYTSSIMAMLDGDAAFYEANPIVDEARHPTSGPSGTEPNGGYNAMKDEAEKAFFRAAAASGGRWAAVSANPADIVGPILSRHQATETWQGKIGAILQGIRPLQETSTLSIPRPWITVDVRDVAEAEIRLAEAPAPGVASGERFLLTDTTRILPEDIGVRAKRLFPDLDPATEVKPEKGQEELLPIHSVWDRVQARNDKVAAATGFKFRTFDDTLKATIDALVGIGELRPRLAGQAEEYETDSRWAGW